MIKKKIEIKEIIYLLIFLIKKKTRYHFFQKATGLINLINLKI